MNDISGVQIAVKFDKKGIYAKFESSNKQRVDWDSISDDQYIDMMEQAIVSIRNMLNNYKNQ